MQLLVWLKHWLTSHCVAAKLNLVQLICWALELTPSMCQLNTGLLSSERTCRSSLSSCTHPTVGWCQVRLAQIGFLILFCHNYNNNLYQSLKQRLGKSNIQARLGRPVGVLMRGGPAGGRGGMRGMTRGGLRGRARGGAMRGALSLRGLCPHPYTVSSYCYVYIFDSSPQVLSPNNLVRTLGIKHSTKWEVLAWEM